MRLRTLGHTGMMVSPIGLGTVKLGRNTGVRYPSSFEIPDDDAARRLLERAIDLGVNLIDTAPAYGKTETRLGSLLHGLRDRVLIATKTGEEFDGVESRFDFSAAHTRRSVERSLSRLRTDHLDIVLIHSDGRDVEILDRGDALGELTRLKVEGAVRAIGISTKTVQGGLRAVAAGCDVVMVTLNLQQQDDLVVVHAARDAGCGVLVKKALSSGHASSMRDSLEFVLSQLGVSAAIVGTIDAGHLAENVEAATKL